MSIRPPRLHVLAGVNGAGKSSIGGASLRSFGGEYYNPDEAARALMAANPALSQIEANGAAWHQGRRLLERALAERLDYAFETTLGANTIPRLLAEAASQALRAQPAQPDSSHAETRRAPGVRQQRRSRPCGREEARSPARPPHGKGKDIESS